MATMTILSILLAVAFTAIAIWKMKGLPESISAMVYALPDGGWRWLWSAWLALLGILTFAPVVEILDGRGLGILGFLPMALLMFVAAWPIFDREHYKWHNILSTVAAVVSQVDVWLIRPYWLLLWLLMSSVVFMKGLRHTGTYFGGKGVLIAEVVCYVALVGALLCRSLVIPLG